MVVLIDLFDAFQHYQDNTDNDEDEKDNIKQLARRGVSFIDDLMKSVFPSRLCFMLFQGVGVSSKILGLFFFLK